MIETGKNESRRPAADRMTWLTIGSIPSFRRSPSTILYRWAFLLNERISGSMRHPKSIQNDRNSCAFRQGRQRPKCSVSSLSTEQAPDFSVSHGFRGSSLLAFCRAIFGPALVVAFLLGIAQCEENLVGHVEIQRLAKVQDQPSMRGLHVRKLNILILAGFLGGVQGFELLQVVRELTDLGATSCERQWSWRTWSTSAFSLSRRRPSLCGPMAKKKPGVGAASRSPCFCLRLAMTIL